MSEYLNISLFQLCCPRCNFSSSRWICEMAWEFKRRDSHASKMHIRVAPLKETAEDWSVFYTRKRLHIDKAATSYFPLQQPSPTTDSRISGIHLWCTQGLPAVAADGEVAGKNHVIAGYFTAHEMTEICGLIMQQGLIKPLAKELWKCIDIGIGFHSIKRNFRLS